MLKLIIRKLVIYTPGFVLASIVWRLMHGEGYSALNILGSFDFIIIISSFALPSVGALLFLNRFRLLLVDGQTK